MGPNIGRETSEEEAVTETQGAFRIGGKTGLIGQAGNRVRAREEARNTGLGAVVNSTQTAKGLASRWYSPRRGT